MRYIKKLIINKDLNLSNLKNVEIKELKIRPEEIKKIEDKAMINFIDFIKKYKENQVILGNESEILTSVKGMIGKYKLIPKNKELILSVLNSDPNLKEIFKSFL
jgi:hypothetical protein